MFFVFFLEFIFVAKLNIIVASIFQFILVFFMIVISIVVSFFVSNFILKNVISKFFNLDR